MSFAAALLQMAKDGLIIVYDPDPDCKLSDGRTCHTVYATKNDVFLTERLKDMYVRPDADDHDMEDADRPGIACGGADGDGSGSVKKSRSGDEAAGSGASGGKQSAQKPSAECKAADCNAPQALCPNWNPWSQILE